MSLRNINIGDVVKSSISINWEGEDNPSQLIVQDILNFGNDWVVAVLNATYSMSDGEKSNQVLLENLIKDESSSRDLLIDQLLSPESTFEYCGHSQSLYNK